jgi:predicted nuclease with TOPRIM domain
MESPSSVNSDENSSSTNCITYGPIRFYGRKSKAPTLSTGRKSKFEELQGEEFYRRELRREKNRLLSKNLKAKRDNILHNLLEEINQLEEQNSSLLDHIEQLHLYKKDLSNKLDNLNRDPLLNLINQNDIPLFFEEYDHEDFDTNSLMSIFSDQQSSLDDLLSD